ncbi:MAG TPA: arsenate reductase (azurin) small subunit [Actinobacteria bacterium]|nr:arsenite oxidase subunit AioB precursor [bacterium BMS3Bbin02]HDL41921.1 arsenate reductase (azurin) small subunit [Actinomycetota bacterium]
MGVTRREFFFAGVAGGAVAAIGVLIPIAVADRDSTPPSAAGTTPPPPAAPPTTPTTTIAPDPDASAAMVGFFPSVTVTTLSDLKEGMPITFDYPQVGQSNILVKMGEPVIGGVGPDDDIVAFSRLCTHMGCVVPDYKHEHKVLGPCPCHYTTFDLVHGGIVSMGQATQNLPQILLSVNDAGDVAADGVFRLVYGYANTLEGSQLVGDQT